MSCDIFQEIETHCHDDKNWYKGQNADKTKPQATSISTCIPLDHTSSVKILNEVDERVYIIWSYMQSWFA